MNMVLLPTESSEKLLRWLLFHPVFYTLYSAFWQLAGIKQISDLYSNIEKLI